MKERWNKKSEEWAKGKKSGRRLKKRVNQVEQKREDRRDGSSVQHAQM